MRTYSNGTGSKAKKTKANFFKKNMYAIILGASLLIVALVITLTLTLGAKKPVIEEPGTGTDVPPIEKISFVNPLKDCTLVQDAALEKLVWNPTLKDWRTHNGVDFGATVGEDVFSVANGTVINVDDTILGGIVVTVKHIDGYVSACMGLDVASVKIGDVVKAGDKIGTIGKMMCENTGAHLHVELQLNNDYVSILPHITPDEK